MRFGKKLALAMIRDAGEAPYLSQKELKHILVGLEKLCKVYVDQTIFLRDASKSPAEVLEHVAQQRLNYGAAPNPGPLEVSEILKKDAEFIDMLSSDVIRIRRYIEAAESNLMEMINGWLEDARESGFLSGGELVDEHSDHDTLLLLSREINHSGESQDDVIATIVSEYERIKQYGDVNTAAIKKLLQRRTKNVDSCFRSSEDFDDISKMRSPESELIDKTVESLRSSLIQ
jgi:hypothetical protein